jgi:L-asparaginase II
MGAPIEDYHADGHPLQQRVKHTVAAVCDLPDDGVQWGIDGCNLPTPAFPLDRLARLYAKLAQAADTETEPDAQTQDARTAALARIYGAMTTHPEMVAGEQRFCTTLMRAFGGDLVGKVGADGSYAIGVRRSALNGASGTPRGATQAIGIAVKVEDGNVSALYAIVVAVLRELGIGTTEQRGALRAFDQPRIRNTKGVETGGMEVRGELLKRGSPRVAAALNHCN